MTSLMNYFGDADHFSNHEFLLEHAVYGGPAFDRLLCHLMVYRVVMVEFCQSIGVSPALNLLTHASTTCRGVIQILRLERLIKWKRTKHAETPGALLRRD
jgi:hypothetical protein